MDFGETEYETAKLTEMAKKMEQFWMFWIRCWTSQYTDWLTVMFSMGNL
jgi:hypothetical protein